VELPGYNGFEILKRLSCQPLVIFVTAFEKYSVQAFEQNGIDFILKPIEPMKLKWAVARAIEQNRRLDTNMIEVVNYILRQKNQIRYFSIKENDQINIIPREDVFFFHSEDKYVFLHTKDKKDFYNASLKELEKTLDPDYFCRINKSHIVAINKIKKIKKNIRNLREYLAVLDDPPKTSLPIGREYLPILKQKLNVR
jgi:DNA-binding LytR/AlgR family response regulator